MKFLKTLPLLVIPLVAILFFTGAERAGLSLPVCKDEPYVVTTIDFFVSSRVLKKHSLETVRSELTYGLKAANQVLANSCVPMRRVLGSVKEVDFGRNYKRLGSIEQVDKVLRNIVGSNAINEILSDPTNYYAVVFSKFDYYFSEKYVGEANADSNSRFFLISEYADQYTIEHELGHLAWAQHNDARWFSTLGNALRRNTSPENQHHLKSYARGYQCSGRGSIMSNAYESIPVYSSPDIHYNGEVCGDAGKADNARVLREFARNLRDQAEL